MNINRIVLALSVLLITGHCAYADGNAFTPLDFSDSSYVSPKSTGSSNLFQKSDLPKTTTNTIDLSAGEIPIGNDNIQNAILELDNAQVGIRNDLLNYKAKYADVDAQYKLVKNERTMLSKQVRTIEKRIKNIDRAKDKIRKNML